MNRCDKILKNEDFCKSLAKTAEYERNRIYCLHDTVHMFDVARIAYIRALETDAKIPKEIIYAAAFIHDIGRAKQYETGVPHEEASVLEGQKILLECGFTEAETEMILKAVSEHRAKDKRSALGELLFYADEKSRMCMLCKARKSCKWREEDMNLEVEY